MKLSVVIPAYNEERRISKTLESVDAYLSKQDYDYELIVVSDGSSDKTGEIVTGFQKTIRNLRLINNAENHGKGYVVRQGLLAANGEYRVFMDADNSTTIDHIERMWPQFAQGYDVVICSRDLKESVIPNPQPWHRRLLGDLFNVLVVQFIGGLWGMWDTQCGFKGFSARATEDIFARAVINRWAFDVEALVVAKRLKYRVKEIPVTWANDPESKVQVGLKSLIRVFLEVVQIRMNALRGTYDSKAIQTSKS